MRKTVLALALVAVVALAGCNFAGGPGDGGTQASPSPTLSDADSPPGVDGGRLANASALLAAHNRTMIGSGFETDLRVNATVDRGGQTAEVRRRQQTLVEPGAAEYQFRVTNTGDAPSARFDYWGNRSVEAVRAQTNAGTNYATGNPRPPAQLATVPFLKPYLATSNYTVASVDRRENRTLVTLRAQSAANYSALVPDNATNVSGYTSTVVADSEGRILSLTVTADYEIRGESGSMELRYRVIRTGGVQVTRPDWTAQAFGE